MKAQWILRTENTGWLMTLELMMRRSLLGRLAGKLVEREEVRTVSLGLKPNASGGGKFGVTCE
jgi:hypothetical protein